MDLRVRRLSNLRGLVDAVSAGEEMLELIRELFPICRSITGNGLRRSLAKLGELLPLATHEVATGTEVFDWTVPKEWNIRDAYIKDAAGRRVVDFKQNNLHVVNYSAPVNARMSLKELRPRLHALPEHPDWIPYRTTYYAESWGFCLSQRQLESLPDGEYEVVIDSTLARRRPHLWRVPAAWPDRRRVSDLGPYLPSVLVQRQSLRRGCGDGSRANSWRRHRIATAIAFCLCRARSARSPGCRAIRTRHERVKHGLVLACVGDRGSINYKRSRRLTADIDRAVEHVLRTKGAPFEVRDFSPYGYDERQYCSPGFNLPVGGFRRTPHGEYPEYHTSADNLEFVSARISPTRSSPCSRSSISSRAISVSSTSAPWASHSSDDVALYPRSAAKPQRSEQLALLWVLNLSDGNYSVLDIAERSGLPFDNIRRAIEALTACGLLEQRLR